jgi:hypothetical protein
VYEAKNCGQVWTIRGSPCRGLEKRARRSKPSRASRRGSLFFRTRGGRQASVLPLMGPPARLCGEGGADHTWVLHGKVPKPPDQSLAWGCLWLNSDKGQDLEVLIFFNPKIKQSSHCCGALARRRVGAAPIDGRIPSGVFCVGSG